MILSQIKNNKDLRELEKKVQKALDYLHATDLHSLDVGKVEIDGDAFFANVQDYYTRNESEINYENHAKYIDVQYMIEGEEKVLTVDSDKLGDSITIYDEGKDITFYKDPTVNPHVLYVKKGDVAIYLPTDAHKTQCSVVNNHPVHIKKIIVKVKI